MTQRRMASKVAVTVRVAASLALVGLASTSAPAADDSLAQRLATCAACHGAAGISPLAEVPSLAGQPKQFIATQLVMFREGNRKNVQMSPLTADLSNADINSMAAHFAALPMVPPVAEQDGSKALAGRALAEQLNCVQCHGPTLKGLQHIPRLAGQHAAYLRTQLRGFKAATRFDMDGNMTSAARALSEADIDLLADYLAALR